MENKIKNILDIVKNKIKNKEEGKDIILYHDVIFLINDYKEELGSLLIENEDKDLNVEEIDFIIVLFCSIYDSWKDFLFSKKFLDEKLGLTSVLLFKEILGDFISIRNLYVLGLENSQNSISRNLLEKFRILFLINCDLEFREEYIHNKSKLTSKNLYNYYTRPFQIKKRLKNYFKNSKNSLLSMACEALSSERTEQTYSLLSKFTHSNETNFMFKYYLKENKYDVSFSNYRSDYSKARIDYLKEFYVYLLAPTINIINQIDEEKENKEMESFCIGYGLFIMKERYNIEV